MLKIKLKANEVGILLIYEIKTKTSNKKAIGISQDKLLKKIKLIYFSNKFECQPYYDEVRVNESLPLNTLSSKFT